MPRHLPLLPLPLVALLLLLSPTAGATVSFFQDDPTAFESAAGIPVPVEIDFDSTGGSLGLVGVTGTAPGGAPGAPVFLGVVADDSASYIGRLVVTESDSNATFPDSNLGYDTPRFAVPAPNTAGLLLFALAALAIRRPRRSLEIPERCQTASMPKRIAISAFASAALLLGPITASAGDEAPSIEPAELHARREAGTAPLVIDVRTSGEYASGHIPGAVNIPFDSIADRISEVDAPNGVALYCMLGPRARKGEAALLAAGYTPVYHVEGGLSAWQAAGLPVEKAE